MRHPGSACEPEQIPPVKNKSNFPEGIIAGAPKSGTTSLFAWLSEHPAVCPSCVKETYFLMDRDSPLFNPKHNYYDSGLVGYDCFFRKCTEDHKLRIEATPDYIYQQTPLDILGADSHTKIIFLLRQPAERAYSAYKFFSGHKSIFNHKISFPDFIQLIRREEGPSDHRLWPLVHNTIRYGEYARYLENWVAALGADNIKIYLFEDLVQNPHAIVSLIARDLEIDPQFYHAFDFPVYNRSYAVKNIKLHRLKHTVAAFLPNSPLKRLIGRIYRRINVGGFTAERSKEDLTTLHALDRYYQPFNDLLSSQFGICLDKWQIGP